MRIAIGSDDAGFKLKEILKDYLSELGIEYLDKGILSLDEKVMYPTIAEKVALSISNKECDRGVLVCGTGIGMCISANKVSGVYAALCHDTYSAERAIKSNNTQIITMGARVIGPELAKKILKVWLECEFVEGPSSSKLDLVYEIDKKYRVG